MTRDELIEAGLRAAYRNTSTDQVDWDRIARVLDAVEPLIRADERENGKWVLAYRDALMRDLRAKVETLKATPPEYEPVELTDGYVWGHAEARRNVLALFDGADQ